MDGDGDSIMTAFSNTSKKSKQMRQDLTAMLGPDQCLFALEDRWTYAFDAGGDRAVPLAVVFAHTPEDVCHVMQYAAARRIPVVPRGAGSGLTGGAVPAMGGIVLVLERMNRILEIDTDNLCATVETGVITQAIVRLVPLPEALKNLAVSFPDIQAAGQVVPMMLKSGVTPCTLEFIDRFCLQAVRKTGLSDPVASLISPDTGAMLLIELDGDEDAVAKEAATVRQICGQCGATGIHSARNPAEREQLWEVRRSIHGALAGLCPHWLEEDIAVPPASIPDMLEKLAALALEQNLRILSFGHFADGNIHLSVSEAAGPLSPQRAGEVTHQIFSLTKALGGRIAAEHGIGLAKKEYLSVNLDDDTLDLALQLKKMLDPSGILNPGKIFPHP
jgi:FAD/FMN-containing dehydrogenase